MFKNPDTLREEGVTIPETLSQILPEFAPGFIGILDNRLDPKELARLLLTSPEMTELINYNKVTVAMIKPRLDKHLDLKKARKVADAINAPGFNELLNSNQFTTDSELSKILINDLLPKDDSITPILSVSVQFDENLLEKFYGFQDENDPPSSPMSRMMKIQANPGRTQWEEFKEMMLMGPSTLIVMLAKDGEAREKWRQKIGPSWNVINAKPWELRHMALGNFCNIWHGSSSEVAVMHEIGLISEFIK